MRHAGWFAMGMAAWGTVAAEAAEFEARHLGEARTLVSGGVDPGTEYLGALTLTAAGRAMPIASGRTAWTISGLVVNGEGFSDHRVGDLMGASSVETEAAAARLFEAYLEHRTPDARGEAALGLIDLSARFDASAVRSLFTHAAHGSGAELGQSGERGPSSYPNAALGLTGLIHAGAGLQLAAGVFDAVPGAPANANRASIWLSEKDGALLISEARIARGPGAASLGVWSYTARHPDLIALDGEGRPRRHDGAGGVYLNLESAPPAAHGGAAWFLRLGAADADIHVIERYLGFGGVFQGSGRYLSGSQFGVALGRGALSQKARAGMREEGLDPAGAETTIEATWRLSLTPALALQPTLQWVRRPGGQRDIDDALIAGLRWDVAVGIDRSSAPGATR
jgi:porin